MAGDEICLVVYRDELGLCKDDAGPSMFEISVWQLMPEELLDRILLFVPASSQARLRCVCKRWSQLVTSSAFRKESEQIASRSGLRNFLGCKLELALAKEAGNDGSEGALHKVDMPGATMAIPGLEINSSRIKVFCGAGLVGVAHMRDGGIVNCWVLNVANKTCRQLPRLFLNRSCNTRPRCRWQFSHLQIWLEPAPESSGSSDSLSNFRVVLMAFHPCAVDAYDWSSPALYTYSSTSTTRWRTVHHPIRPHPKWWSRAVTKGAQLHPTRIHHVQAKMILGNILILVCSIWEYYPGVSREQHAIFMAYHLHEHAICMAYHMHDGFCQWFRLPAQAFRIPYSSEHNNSSVFLEPTLVSHLRL